MQNKLLLGSLLALALVTPVHATAWELTWSDEFEIPGLPDPSKWSYEQGYLRNHEAQFYTHDRLENARVENGLLILEARKEPFVIPPGTSSAPGRQFADYTSASLHTRGKFALTYGRVEMRAKLPHGKGVWPAFWMLGVDIPQVGWPACGEIDAMELVGKEPDEIHGTVHWQGDGRHQAQGGQLHVDRTGAEFHVYAVEWTPEHINFSVDDRVYNRVQVARAGAGVDNPFHKPQYLLLNFALGGEWGGEIDDRILPQRYFVDYVRVYREKASGK